MTPRNPQDVTATWLTDTLRSTGILKAEEISAIQTTVMGDGQGFTGQVARIELEYTTDNETAPTSLIAKFPPADPEFYKALEKYGIYEREGSFYKEVGNDVCLNVPKLYYSHIDREKSESIVLLEDFHDAEPLDPFAGMSLDEALYDLKVFDWQICNRGSAIRDVVYFIANSVTNGIRKKHETTMLNTYYETLIKQGVTNFSMDDCKHAYKLSTLDFYVFMVAILVLIDFDVSEDTLAFRDLILERWGGFIMDHYPIDLLPQS